MPQYSPAEYHTSIQDARGTVIGRENRIYNYFLNERFAPLASKIITFSTLIEERTRDFVGRDFIFREITRFLEQVPSGYFVLKGEAGVGKTALMAHLAKTRGFPHHFVVSSQGITRPEQFLESICGQLIARFELNRPAVLAREAGNDSSLFSELLAEVSRKLKPGAQAVLLVDALDEADWRPGRRENVLYLPEILPPNVFIIATARHREDIPLQVERSHMYYLDPESPENRSDVLAYITRFADREGMRARLASWRQTPASFASTILTKSEGNFMYLRHVLPAIEAGQFEHGTVDELPQGLRLYYERHWERIRAIDENAWVEYRQPVIAFLAAARESVTVWQIAEWSGLKPARVLAAIREWREFLDEDVAGNIKRYRIYHSSFRDFLAAKDEARTFNHGERNAAREQPAR